MKLNKSKGNMYEFVTHTWNPIKGRCYHDCAYCYMKILVPNPQSIHLDESELNGKSSENQFIFIGSSTDVFASDVPSEWITAILDFCVEATSHQQGVKTRFLLQTKNPARILEFTDHSLFMNGQVVACTTLETNRHYPETMNNAPVPKERAEAMAKIAERGIKTYVTIEPIMEFDLDELVSLVKMCAPGQVNIGANTVRSVEIPEPAKGNILIDLIQHLLCFTQVKVKKNLNGDKLTRMLIRRLKRNYSYEKRD